MTFPTPIYIYTFDGQDLPGYGQLERANFKMKAGSDDIVNRNGGILYTGGAAVRPVVITLNIFSRLITGSGLDHLNDLKDQIREALRICARPKEPKQLFLGDTDRYMWAVFDDFDQAFAAEDGRRGQYSLSFQAQPLFHSTILLTDTVSANGTLTVTTGDTAETYPTFLIASTVTAAVLTAPDGRTITFTRGAVTGEVSIDCATFRIEKTSDGTNVSSTVDEVNIGFAHEGTGNFDVVVSDYAGSGDITMQLRERYER